MKLRPFSSKLAVIALCAGAVLATHDLRATELSETDKEFLSRYENVRAALARDNLDDAKKAATELGEEGAALAKADTIAAARNEFSSLSVRAIKLAAGESAYYVVNCPMLKKDWVQPRGEISNPYAGRSMPTCGMIKK